MFRLFSAITRSISRLFKTAEAAVRSVRRRLDLHLTERGLTFFQLVLQAINYVLARHEILSRASAIAFCAMLSFIPFITLVLTIGAHLLPTLGTAAHATGIDSSMGISAQEVAAFLQTIFPKDAAALIIDQIARIQEQPPLAVISITLFLALWTSSSMYSEIINALNRILGVTETRPFWKIKLRTMGMVLLETALLFGAFVMVLVWPGISASLGLTAWAAAMASAAHWLLLFTMIYLSFAIIFLFGPDNKSKPHWVSPGALFGTLIFLLTTYGFRIYLEYFAHYSAAYGSLGGVMMLMFWMWLMSLVLLISAEINKLAAITDGSDQE
jgi:membrane protein